jgi:sugar (pentulose or hexulose) kinase
MSARQDGSGDVAPTTAGRRDFLKALTGAGALAATAAVGTEEAEAQAQSQASDRETPAEQRKARYQPNAPDVQNFYRTNRY